MAGLLLLGLASSFEGVCVLAILRAFHGEVEVESRLVLVELA